MKQKKIIILGISCLLILAIIIFLQKSNNKTVQIQVLAYNYDVDKNTNFYYYSQLDDSGKTIYSELYKNRENLKSGMYTVNFNTNFNELLHEIEGKEKLQISFQAAINALILDHPEIFYLDVSKLKLEIEYAYSLKGKLYKVKIEPTTNKGYLSDGYKLRRRCRKC